MSAFRCLPLSYPAVLLLAASLAGCSNSVAEEASARASAPYRNRAYSYELRIPLPYVVIAHTDESLTIGRRGTGGTMRAVEVRSVRGAANTVKRALLGLCSADGAECPGIAERKPYTSPAGLDGYRYMLTQRARDGSDRRGPYYSFTLRDGVVVMMGPHGSGDVDASAIAFVAASAGPLRTIADARLAGASRASRGARCGGIAGMLCAEGFTCRYDGAFPDAGGMCVR